MLVLDTPALPLAAAPQLTTQTCCCAAGRLAVCVGAAHAHTLSANKPHRNQFHACRSLRMLMLIVLCLRFKSECRYAVSIRHENIVTS
jgi:hypothetical protein